ncbi:hypothetical protein NEILACOT_04191 [Neisseria lactamica ATCC 23970]|uniref:Uncharacterized protein n=1 Tax=Neisseria lactamica ATCC 23970 TaxID=546265 RepID=D0W9H9_NEILA|nr:hypothetical protein NEILACOT_04191 [Neisseria lactamica ATCC 23970]
MGFSPPIPPNPATCTGMTKFQTASGHCCFGGLKPTLRYAPYDILE